MKEELMRPWSNGDGEIVEFDMPWKAPWLHAFAKAGQMKQACEAVGIPPHVCAQARRSDKVFLDAYLEVRDTLGDEVEGLAMQKARAGDTIMIIFLLKNLRPETYSDRLELRHTGTAKLELETTGGQDPRAFTAEQRHRAAAMLMQGVDDEALVVDATVVDEPNPSPEEASNG